MGEEDNLDQLEILSHVEPRITITIIGDASKTIVMPIWAQRSEIPGAWSVEHNVSILGQEYHCIGVLWDIMQGSVVHMFPSDSVDHTILFYDMSLRRTDIRSRKYSIQDYLKHIIDMKGQHKETTCILIKDEREGQAGAGAGEIIRACKQKGIKKVYTLNNTGKDIGSLKTLVTDIITRIYTERRRQANQAICDYLDS